ncbi:hypothetical protein pb186bvf_003631 [Paramecium bursaria]
MVFQFINYYRSLQFQNQAAQKISSFNQFDSQDYVSNDEYFTYLYEIQFTQKIYALNYPFNFLLILFHKIIKFSQLPNLQYSF